MKCIACESETIKVTDSRPTNDGWMIRRRRECEHCHIRFSTVEHLEILHLIVNKRSGEKEEYAREKLEIGIRKALEKRPVTPEQFTRLIFDIERTIQRSSKRQSGIGDDESARLEISSKEIGYIVMNHLKKHDHVAYIRFASVYRAFNDVSSFEKEIKNIYS